MITRVIVVQPIGGWYECDKSDSKPMACDATAPEAGYEANGQILAKLAALLQAAIANAPQLISEISTIIALFGGKLPPAPSPAA